jgi:hypothetical protein
MTTMTNEGAELQSAVNDKEFVDDLRTVRNLRSFLFDQGVQFSADESDILIF